MFFIYIHIIKNSIPLKTKISACCKNGNMRLSIQKLHNISYTLIFLLLFTFVCTANELEEEVSYDLPSLLPLIKEQWTDQNHEAIKFQIFNLSKGLLPKGSTLSLTLQETIRLALHNNLALRSEGYTIKIAETEIKKAEGAFDTYITTSLAHSLSLTPSATSQNKIKNINSLFDIGLGKPIKTGGLLELKFDLDRTEGNLGSWGMNPFYTTHLNLSLTQPLLKNAGLAYQTAPIHIAKNLHLISQDNCDGLITETIMSVMKAYWELAFAFQNKEVHQKSLALANELLKNNEIQVQLGKKAPIDLLQAKTGVAIREEELLSAENLLQTSQDLLKELLNLEAAPIYSAIQIIPTERPLDSTTIRFSSLHEAITMALKNHPEYRAAQKDLKTKNMQIKVAKNQILPNLEIIGNLGLNGSGGSAIESIDSTTWAGMTTAEQQMYILLGGKSPMDQNPLDGGWEKSMEELFSQDSHNWQIGLRISHPLKNSAAKADYVQAKMNAYKILWSIRNLEQKLIFEVKEAWRAIQSQRQKIRTSDTTQQLAKQQLEAEEKKLSLGTSTNYQVLQMEEDFRTAQIKVMMAKVEYRKALARLDKVTGILLENEGIAFLNK